MTNPDPRPWQQPTAPYPQPPAKKKKSALMVVLLSILGVLVLCVGTTVTLGLSGALDEDRPAAKAPAADVGKAAPLVGATSSRPAVKATPTPKPTRTATPAPSRTTVRLKPATKKPKPRATTTRPKPRPTTKAPTGQKGVHPGSFCSPEGATGFTNKGTRMRCTLKSGEDRARWRKA